MSTTEPECVCRWMIHRDDCLHRPSANHEAEAAAPLRDALRGLVEALDNGMGESGEPIEKALAAARRALAEG